MLISILSLFWPRNILCMILILLNLLRFILWPQISWYMFMGMWQECVFCYCWVECLLPSPFQNFLSLVFRNLIMILAWICLDLFCLGFTQLLEYVCSWLWTSRPEVPRQSAFCFPPFTVFLWLFAVLCPGIFSVRGRTWKMWVHGKGLFPSQLPYPQPHSQWKPALQINAQTHPLTPMTSVNWVHVSDFPMKCSQARDLVSFILVYPTYSIGLGIQEAFSKPMNGCLELIWI